MMRGKFITFEGSEGCGKSTQSKLLYNYLKRKGDQVIYLREPGSTKIGEQLRKILLEPGKRRISPLDETLLYMLARAQAVKQIIKPALKQGRMVICDRFLDSTLAYQGYGLGVDISFIKSIGRLATDRIKPDLTILLDTPVREGLRRCGGKKDRIERRSLSYHQRVRDGYLKLAHQEPQRIKIVRLDRQKTVTQERIRDVISGYQRSR